jgi:branched-chain amino acid transport system permease protein
MVGILFGLPSLKVKGFYLIMTTLAAQFIIIWIIIQLRSLTGGVDGLAAIKPKIAGVALTSKQTWFYLVMIFACMATFFAKNLARSRVGRVFVAIRDNDLAAEIIGCNLFYYKLEAFFIGCMFAGFAGSLLVHYVGFASPEQFTLMDSVWYLGMLIVGGMGSTVGAIFGTIFLRLLDELVTIFSPAIASAFPAIAVQAAASMGLMAHALVIILFLIFEPRGLAHRWEITKKYFRLWPFSY